MRDTLQMLNNNNNDMKKYLDVNNNHNHHHQDHNHYHMKISLTIFSNDYVILSNSLASRISMPRWRT